MGEYGFQGSDITSLAQDVDDGLPLEMQEFAVANPEEEPALCILSQRPTKSAQGATNQCPQGSDITLGTLIALRWEVEKMECFLSRGRWGSRSLLDRGSELCPCDILYCSVQGGQRFDGSCDSCTVPGLRYGAESQTTPPCRQVKKGAVRAYWKS